MFKDRAPSDEELLATLGEAGALWQELIDHIMERHGPVRGEWKKYGKSSGWTRKTLIKKRNLFFLTPLSGRFCLGFVFGDKAVTAIAASDLPKHLIDELVSARKYAEGRGLPLMVTGSEELEIAKQLVDFKLGV